MHQKNSDHVGSSHIEGFQDCSKTIDTWDEPCISSYRAVLPVILEVTRQMLQILPREGKLFPFYSLGAILEAISDDRKNRPVRHFKHQRQTGGI